MNGINWIKSWQENKSWNGWGVLLCASVFDYNILCECIL